MASELPLMEKLRNAEPHCRFEALRELKEMAPDPLLKAEVVRICQSDKMPHLRLEAVRALRAYWPDPEVMRAYQTRLSDELYIAEEVITLLGGLADSRALDMLERCFFASTNMWVKIKAIIHLQRSPQRRLYDFVIRSGILTHKDERLRAAAVSLLSRIDNPTLANLYVTRLSDPCPRVRANALEALAARFPTRTTARLLVERLADGHHRVRAVAVRYLLHYGYRRAEETLAGMVEASESLMRASAAWVLRESGATPRRVEWASRLSRDPDDAVSSLACAAHERLSVAGHGGGLAAAAQAA